MYKQLVLSAPAKLPVMIKRGRKEVQATYVTPSGQTKKKYVKNPLAQPVKVITHKTRVLYK